MEMVCIYRSASEDGAKTVFSDDEQTVGRCCSLCIQVSTAPPVAKYVLCVVYSCIYFHVYTVYILMYS